MTTNWDHVNGNITMRIADTGSVVEYWVLTDSYTFNHDQTWSYSANGVNSAVLKFDMNNRGSWQKVGSFTITSDQTVRFTMYDTGLGFGTYDFTHFIDRASAPSAPAKPILTVRSSTTIELDWGGDGADNGAAIDSRQFAGNSSNTLTGATIKAYAANYQWTGLAAGTTYYFWERTHNAKGYSPWSPVASAKTWNVPNAPGTPTLSNITNTTVDVAFTDGANNGQGIDTREIGYGTDPNTPQTVVTSDGSTTITGLTPGTVYYFWARTHNSVGWSAYGTKASTTTKRPPDAPTTPVLSEVDQTTMRVVFAANGDGGSPITGYRIGYGKSSSAPEAYATSDLDDVLTGLDAGTPYYVWGQAQNAYGWGSLSAVSTVRTAAGAWVNVNGVWKEAVPYVNVNGVWKLTKAWAKIAGVWKETR